jgi:Pentapeptide repeats (8 copies)
MTRTPSCFQSGLPFDVTCRLLLRLSWIVIDRPDTSQKGLNLTRKNLAGTNVARANLTSANLTGSHAIDAHMQGADLTRANLAYADLPNADPNAVIWGPKVTGHVVCGGNSKGISTGGGGRPEAAGRAHRPSVVGTDP